MNRKGRNIVAKGKTVFVCSECGYESAKWLGKCPGCGQWNCFYEEKIVKDSKSSFSKIVSARNTAAERRSAKASSVLPGSNTDF